MKKKALTAGELLITMTVVGVIAVLTIPGLVQDYQNKMCSAKIRKIYSEVTNAIERACNDKNSSYFYMTKYDGTNSTFLNEYFNTVTSANYFASEYSSIGTASDDDAGVTISDTKAKLKSGEAISFSCTDNKCDLVVDINSTAKPNIAGRDLFTFSIDATTNQPILNDSATCTTSTSGVGCLEKLMENNWKMDY